MDKNEEREKKTKKHNLNLRPSKPIDFPKCLLLVPFIFKKKLLKFVKKQKALHLHQEYIYIQKMRSCSFTFNLRDEHSNQAFPFNITNKKM